MAQQDEAKVEQKDDVEMKTVICLSHHQEVEVKLIPYGDGHIAECPDCGELAYNGK